MAPRSDAAARRRVSGALFAVACVGTLVAVSQRRFLVESGSMALAASGVLDYGQHESSSSTSIAISNAYERGTHKIGDGLYPWTVVEVHTLTRLEASPVDSAMEYAWAISSGVDTSAPELVNANALGASLVEVTFTTLGMHTLTLSSKATGAMLETKTVKATYVRREIRTLTDAARETFLSALETTYNVDQKAGERLYGRKYRSMASLVELHLKGAASKECDHWHDDAGILTLESGFLHSSSRAP